MSIKDLRNRYTTTATASCNICKTVQKVSGGSTSGLIKHAKLKHEIIITIVRFNFIVLFQLTGNSTSTSTGNQNKIKEFFQQKKTKDSFEVVLSRMVALDGFTFKVSTTSNDLRKALTAEGYDVPSSPVTIQKVVMNFADKIRQILNEKIKILFEKGERFNISHDEWSSMKSRRYMNIILHYDETNIWNLGLIRVTGKMGAEAIVEKIKERLIQFGISPDHQVICQMTDGSVLDVLYEKPKKKTFESQHDQSNEFNDGDDEEPEPIDDDTEIDDVDLFIFPDDLEGNFDVIIEENEEECGQFPSHLKAVIQKVRTIVKKFKSSPKKNDCLQEYVLADFKHEMQLSLDCRTRWTSLLDMLERFYQVRRPIKKALIDVGEGLDIDDEELMVVLEIVNALKTSILHTELDNAIAKALTAKVVSAENHSKTSISKLVKQEMKLLEAGGGRGKYLSVAYKYLFSIKPTSVESERAFSACGYLCPKIRCRMNDRTLNRLSFLRRYFQNEKEREEVKRK
ncbi:hypothetical protein Bhyg_07087 [Pseudolycoriella hygida]|uniref:HAT C-terminal dimerisation domain-containing protein n=1 Tax=Pseudolycoriella hygida TaxID=35572 RepID=A0A9Q0N1W9_9DIPT|nr:hypothetical protein Bhyg_07087 [Pseudolycoriella hygida]